MITVNQSFPPDQNEKGEWAMWENGKLIGYKKLITFQGCLVDPSDQPLLQKMVDDAAKDGVKLSLAVGYRPITKQLAARTKNVIDKSKANDLDYHMTQSSNKYNPLTSRPGFSKHQKAKAWDWNVTDPTNNKKTLPSYPWLVKNAINYSMLRSVTTERWHFEYWPGKDQFFFVPKNHPTWDNLV